MNEDLKSAQSLMKSNIVVTPAGALLLIVCAYLLVGPAINQADIVAFILSFSIIILILCFLIATIVQRVILGDKLRIQVFAPESSDQGLGQIFAGQGTELIILSSPIKLLPLFQLKMALQFKNEGTETVEHVFTGYNSEERRIIQRVRFPHRGFWMIDKIELTLSDRLNVSRLSWPMTSFDRPISFTVRPPVSAHKKLPILSSFYKTGDHSFDLHQKQGDPYDIKKYHPSDGARKIIWKMYAKSRELLSRHPEPSITPEGQVAVFCIAGKREDTTASAALAYLTHAEDLGLDLLFSCEGAQTETCVETAKDSEKLLINSVWETESSSVMSIAKTLSGFLDQIKAKTGNTPIARIIVFCSPERLKTEEMLRSYLHTGTLLSDQGIQPVFYIPKPDIDSKNALPVEVSFSRKFMQFFLYQNDLERAVPPHFYPEFVNACLKRQWQVLS